MNAAADREFGARPPDLPAARTLARDADEYPAGLRDLPDSPARLHVVGTLPRTAAVAIVGSRAATPYGAAFARRLACDLARLGVPIVSGLARGIDAAAHRGALEGGGITIAVLPSGLDTITPPHHAGLAAEIARQGALVTEIETGGPGSPWQFVRRNRLIAALAVATVVVEAAESSGALSTAAVARKLGRALLAVPGDVTRPTARGCHALLREGARLCAGVADVAAALDTPEPAPAAAGSARAESAATLAPGGRGRAPLAPRSHARAHPPLARRGVAPDANPEARVLAALDAEPVTIDVVARRSGLDVPAALAALGPLEWSGLARAEPGPRWRRA